MEKNKEINIKDLIIKIVLIIIIIILLLHNCSLLKTIKENKNKKAPTGNVDIFEILCDKKECEVKDDTKKETQPENKETKDNTNKKTTPVNNETKDNEELTISDNDITWKSTNQLRIFNNPVYGMNGKIAPEDSNVYQFVIKNNTQSNVKYNMTFIENNPHSINIKYKLKKGDTYLAGNKNNYVSYDELNQTKIKINKNSSDTYYLEWKWISSEEDTKFQNINKAYDLSIQIEAESINE